LNAHLVSLEGPAQSTKSVTIDLAGVEHAQHLIEQAIRPVSVDWVALSEARGRVLGSPMHAADDIIPFARSAMDGYAVRALDVAAACGDIPLLRVVGDVFAQRPLCQYEVGPVNGLVY
jgi:molybdopterin biosynthesis enzyme